jgi:radical SAM protein with 4Fe4S-binding SPASM domain
MNLLLTNYCNQNCAYCFARGKVLGKENVRLDFNPKDLNKVISFFEKSNQRKIDLLGGEPTLHPYFEAIVQGLLDKDFQVQIFTNGIIPDRALSFLKTIPRERMHCVININPLKSYEKQKWERVERTLATLGASASLGFNIDRVDFSCSFLFDLIKQHQLKKYLRLGIAQPILEAGNRFVPFHQYQDLAPRIMQLVEKADRQNIVVMFDCGFTLCMFTPAQLGRLYLARAMLTFHCNPAIDIGPDLTVWHCFPLSSIENVSLEQYKNAEETIDYYRQRLAPYKRMGASERCRHCRYLLRGQCSGGCLAHTIGRFKTG